MNLPPENDTDYSWMWHTKYWNREGAVTSNDTGIVIDVVIPSTNIIKYKKADWLDGLQERKLPDCLLQWPIIKVDA